MDVLAEERDREVRNILTSIADLAQIMKDLSTLVIDQGTVLDRIDYNMEQARRRSTSRDGFPDRSPHRHCVRDSQQHRTLPVGLSATLPLHRVTSTVAIPDVQSSAQCLVGCHWRDHANQIHGLLFHAMPPCPCASKK